MTMLHRLLPFLLGSFYCSQGQALDIRSSVTPGANVPTLTTGELAINRVDKRLSFKNVDGTLGYGSLLNATPAGRKAVEQGDASGLTGLTFNGLDPQAVTSIQVSPTFCPYSQLTGTTTNDACVQAAIYYACATTNSPANKVAGELVFGRADYYIRSGVIIPKACSGLQLRGQGSGSSGGTRIVSDNNCTAPVINFYPDATQNYVYGGGVSNLYFFNNTLTGGSFTGTTSCSKPLIQANFVRNMHFDRLSTLSPFTFVKLVGGNHLVINDITGYQALPNSTGVFEFTGYGARPDATGAATRQDGVNLNNVTVFGAAAPTGNQLFRGIWWHGFSPSLRTTNTAFVNTSRALKVDCTGPGIADNLKAAVIEACPAFGIFNDFEAEAAGANVVDITDAQSLQFNFLYAACFARTSTATPATSGCNSAMKVMNNSFNTTGGITINGGIINNAQASGISYEGFQLVVTGGTHIYGHNAANVGGSGITLETPIPGNASGSHVITGNIFCMGPAANSIGETALNSISGNDYVVFTSNSLRGCGAGVIGSVGAKGMSSPNAGP